MGKPAKKNGFSILLSEIRRDHRNLSDKELIERADVIWRGLPADQKARYVDRAKKANDHSRGVGANDNAFPKPHLDEMEGFLTAAHSFTDSQSEIESIKFLMNGNIVDFPFIIVSINHFLSTESRYVPAELAITRVSLNDGIIIDDATDSIDYLHSFFRASRLPPMEIPKIKAHVEESHKIPYDTTEHIEEEWEKARLVQRVYNYIHYKGERRAYVFVADDEMEQTRRFFEYLQQVSEQENTSRFNFKVVVFSLASLYSYLYSLANNNKPPADKNEPINAFQATNFLYYGLCYYHRTMGNRYCALGRAKNYSWLLCKAFAPKFGIPLVKGQHVPDDILQPM